jgi:hypothetical protein
MPGRNNRRPPDDGTAGLLEAFPSQRAADAGRAYWRELVVKYGLQADYGVFTARAPGRNPDAARRPLNWGVYIGRHDNQPMVLSGAALAALAQHVNGKRTL